MTGRRISLATLVLLVLLGTAAQTRCAPPAGPAENSAPTWLDRVRWWRFELSRPARARVDEVAPTVGPPPAPVQTRQKLFEEAQRQQGLSATSGRVARPASRTERALPSQARREADETRRGAIDPTVFAGLWQSPPPETANLGAGDAMRDDTQPVGEGVPPLSLPELAQEPPFTDELPPIAQMSYEQYGADEKPEVARPLFNQLLEDSGEPMPVLNTGWHVPSWGSDEDDSSGGWFSGADEECEECWDNPWKRLFCLGIHRQSGDIGIGEERVALAGFEIDASQPFNNVRVRYDAVYGLPFPDRAEYFWAKSGKGPPSAGEIVNYQDLRLYSEIGGRLASAIVEYPLRSLDPEINGNTTGFGDMVVGNKAVIVNGRYWQITQVFRTYINTGSSRKGLGTGHVSLEPGVLARYRWTDNTYLHGEFKFLFPVGADPNFAGQVLRGGIGWTHLGYETDTFALIHSTELVMYSFLDGLKTVAPPDITTGVDGDTFGTWLYGMRFVLGPSGDLGLFEVGVNGGVGIGTDWYDGLFRLDFRWSY